MKKEIVSLVLSLASFQLFAQGYCIGDTVVFTEPAHPVAYDDVVYKTAPQIDEWFFNVPDNIRLRVYYPTDLPAAERRPLVVLIHGGYFIWGNYLDFDGLAKSLAEKGFVAATVGYRLCNRTDCVLARATNYPCNVSWPYSFVPTAYVAAVDVHDGIRWLQERAATYHIDPDKIIVGGHSAGAYTALNVAFMDQDEVQQVIPSAGVSGKYLGEPLDPVTGIRACIPLVGAIFDLDWIGTKEITEQGIAVGIVHGTNDGVVAYDSGPPVPCCQTYGGIVYGGCSIAKHIRALGGSYYMLTGKGYGHDIGEPAWADELAVQLPAFIIRTAVCGKPIEKHSIHERIPPLPLCPNNTPNLPAPPVCDLVTTTPPIVTPTHELHLAYANHQLPLSVYPSVTDGSIHIEALTPEANTTWLLTAMSMDGRVVFRGQLPLDGITTVELSDAPPGVYGLFFQSAKSGKSGVVRVVKAR